VSVQGYLDPTDTVRGVTRDLRAVLGGALVRLSLYGSRARGDADPSSDFDFMVVLSGVDPELKTAVHAVAGDWLVDHRVDVSAKVLPLAEFRRLRRSGHPFWRRFERDEVVLWPLPS
jgi:predicted nucleotidyltransferase